jgi:hypothetical protein
MDKFIIILIIFIQKVSLKHLNVTIYPISTPKIELTTVRIGEIETREDYKHQIHRIILHDRIARHFMTSTINPRIPLIPPASIHSQIAKITAGLDEEVNSINEQIM